MARKFSDALDHEITQPDALDIPATGDISGLRDSVIEPVSDMSTFTEKAAQLAFNEEPLEIMIHEGTDQNNPEPYVFLAINGRGPGPAGTPWVPRGVPVTLARKFVERLCRAKPVSLRTVEQTMPDGSKGIRVVRNSSLQYPFSVIRDDNPRGAAWLRDLMRAPA